MEKYLLVIISGIIAGFLNRYLTLRIDYRYYPTYPHGYMTHLSLGFIAAALGAVAIPAIAEPDYAAVTFLVLAAQQFREIRNMERDTLSELDKTKIIQRGQDYIEGIARVFEARNYLTIATSFLTSAVLYFWVWQMAVIIAILCMVVSLRIMRGNIVGQIAEIVPGKLSFDNSLLMVEDIVIMNVGLPESRTKILNEGLAVILKPKDDNARLTLDAPGQRMAIIHDVVSILGSKVDVDEKDFMPLMRKQPDKGYFGIFILANEPDLEYLIEIIKRVPVLESAQGTTLKSYFGRKAAD